MNARKQLVKKWGLWYVLDVFSKDIAFKKSIKSYQIQEW